MTRRRKSKMKKIKKIWTNTIDYLTSLVYRLWFRLANYAPSFWMFKRYFINLKDALLGRVQRIYAEINTENAYDYLGLLKEKDEIAAELESLRKKLSRKTATVAKSPVKKKKTSSK
jgi:ATP-dependent RNA circularization protein (DNA/RNA ligase family)